MLNFCEPQVTDAENKNWLRGQILIIYFKSVVCTKVIIKIWQDFKVKCMYILTGTLLNIPRNSWV